MKNPIAQSTIIAPGKNFDCLAGIEMSSKGPGIKYISINLAT